MPRIVEVMLPPEKTDSLLARVEKLNQVISIRVHKHAAVKPSGDVVAITVTNRSLSSLLKAIDELDLTSSGSASVSSSRPEYVSSRPEANSIRNDSSESNWEEMESALNSESTMTLSSCVTMTVAGVIAACGLMTSALHVVIAAMVIAPGFEPISRIALGIVTRSATWKRGLTDALKAYACLIVGAALATLLLKLLGYALPAAQGSYLQEDTLLLYWTSTSSISLIISLSAGVAGALLIINHRSVLTAGVMIALALIPAGALIGIGLVVADGELMAKGASRLLMESLLVLTTSLLVYGWKRYGSEKRTMPL